MDESAIGRDILVDYSVEEEEEEEGWRDGGMEGQSFPHR